MATKKALQKRRKMGTQYSVQPVQVHAIINCIGGQINRWKGLSMLETRLLQYFLTVAEERNITNAARTLHITQPTLSRQMAQLEQEVGVKLFKKGSRPLELTNEGMLLRRRASEILELAQKTERELSSQEVQLEGRISIGSGELYAADIMSNVIAAFHREYPRVLFDVYTANADEIKNRMDDGLTDIGLLLEPVDVEKYDYIRMSDRERWVVLIPSGVPLARKEYVTPEDLAEIPVIMPSRQKIHDEVASWFGSYYTKLNISAVSNLSTNAALMVKAGMGYALIVEGGLPFLDRSEICMRPLKPELFGTTVLTWKRNQPMGLAVEKFVKFTKCFLGMEVL